MAPPPVLRRLAALLLLVPWLLSPATGRGLVVCVGPDGHLRLEVVASACCDDLAPGAPAGWAEAGAGPVVVPDAGADGRADCGSCDDLRIALDVHASRAHEERAEHPAQAAPPLAAPAALVSRLHADGPGGAAPARAARGLAPPSLRRLRGVALRC